MSTQASALTLSMPAVLVPLLSTAWYSHFHWPATLMQVSSIRQLAPTLCLRRRKAAANTGRIFIAQRCTVEWSTKTPLLHHFFNVSQTERVGHVPPHAGKHHIKGVVQPLQDLVQGAVDQTVAEIKHGQDCRLCLMRHNRQPACQTSHPLRQNRWHRLPPRGGQLLCAVQPLHCMRNL